MLGRKYENAALQSDFYRDQYRKLLRWVMLSVFISIILIGCIIYMILFQPQQSYYANTTEGKILPMPIAVVQKTG